MYCNKQDMLDRFGAEELVQLTDEHHTGDIDDVIVQRAIDDAAAEIDGYLATRYQLPLASVPPGLVRIACDMARYYLYSAHAPDSIKDRYDDAVRFLRAVAGGTITLVRDTGATAETAGVAEFESGRNEFNGGGF